MFRKKFILALILIPIMLLIVTKPTTWLKGRSGLGAQEVQASDLAIGDLYLPMIGKNYPPPPPAFGVQIWKINSNQGLTEMVDAGASWVRRNGVDWDLVEPIKGTRDWGALAGMESELINAQENGLEPILIVLGTPEWARKYPDYRCGPIKQEELGTFASFVGELVARYSLPPYNVKYWEIWNEPDAAYSGIPNPEGPFGCWGEGSDPYYGGEYYGQMLSLVTPKIKTADPAAKVIVGGLVLDCDPINPPLDPNTNQPKYCASSLFLEGILRAGGGAYFDGVGFHAYDYYAGQLGRFSNFNWHASWDSTGTVISEKVQYIRSLLDSPEFGVQGKFLMNTESALICGATGDPPGTPPCDSDPASGFETTKAYYVAKAYAEGQSLGLRASIWFEGWRNSDLLNEDLSPRPAYTAYAVAQNAFDQSTFNRIINEYAGVEGYEFIKDGRRVWVVWSKDGITHTINLSKVPSSSYDVFGTAMTPTLAMQIGLKPVYLEWNN